MLTEWIADLLAGHHDYPAIQALPRIGPSGAAVAFAEIGDISRFRALGNVASWAGLTARHRESDTKAIRGHVTKHGSHQPRWVLMEVIQHRNPGQRSSAVKNAIMARRGE